MSDPSIFFLCIFKEVEFTRISRINYILAMSALATDLSWRPDLVSSEVGG
jgi:hypothetical protein